jgi:hypothetical protein
VKLYQRIITIGAATVAGLAGSLIAAVPAHASAPTIFVDYDDECLPDGTRQVTWEVFNTAASLTATITAVTLLPAGSTVSDIEVGATIPGDDSLPGSQILPGDASSAKLTVSASWPGVESPYTDDASATAEFRGTCSPLYTVTEDCAGITFTFPAVDDGGEFPPKPIDVSLIPSTGDSQAFQLKGGDPEKKVTFPGSTGLTVALSYGDDFKKTHAWTSAPCPVPDLPKTGSSLTGPAAIGGTLLLVGAALVIGTFMFRRRRTIAGS